jgi:hypothetical protein
MEEAPDARPQSSQQLVVVPVRVQTSCYCGKEWVFERTYNPFLRGAVHVRLRSAAPATSRAHADRVHEEQFKINIDRLNTAAKLHSRCYVFCCASFCPCSFGATLMPLVNEHKEVRPGAAGARALACVTWCARHRVLVQAAKRVEEVLEDVNKVARYDGVLWKLARARDELWVRRRRSAGGTLG